MALCSYTQTLAAHPMLLAAVQAPDRHWQWARSQTFWLWPASQLQPVSCMYTQARTPNNKYIYSTFVQTSSCCCHVHVACCCVRFDPIHGLSLIDPSPGCPALLDGHLESRRVVDIGLRLKWKVDGTKGIQHLPLGGHAGIRSRCGHQSSDDLQWSWTTQPGQLGLCQPAARACKSQQCRIH